MATVAEALAAGWRRHQSGDVSGAESIYRQVLAAAPNDANAWCYLGIACHDQGRFADAVEAYDRAIAIQPAFPVALSNRGNSLRSLDRIDDAIASCRRALAFQPEYATAHNNLATALLSLGRAEESADEFRETIRLLEKTTDARTLASHATYCQARKNLGIVRLLLADYATGWREYAWRWRCPGNALPPFPQPLWDGGSLTGRTILLYPEQGLGDTLHFVRYAPWVKARGGRVIAACQPPLLRLLPSCPGLDAVVPLDRLPPFDTWAPLLNLPALFGTDAGSILANVPYLAPPPELLAVWKTRLEASQRPDVRLRAGITWQGNPQHFSDRQRSIPLAHFLPLAEIPGVRLISLQKGFGQEQLTALAGGLVYRPAEGAGFDESRPTAEAGAFGWAVNEASHQGTTIEDWGDVQSDFADTAAIVRNLDLVITSDTSLAHLAGAVGAPTWLALHHPPDWRWLLDRRDSPWYPTLRLFRQPAPGDWPSVFSEIAAALRE